MKKFNIIILILLIFCIFPSVYSLANNYIGDVGLVTWYNFNNNCNDISGQNRSCTPSGVVMNTSCYYNGCYYFDGSNDYIQINASSSLAGRTKASIVVLFMPSLIAESKLVSYAQSAGSYYGFDLTLTATGEIQSHIRELATGGVDMTTAGANIRVNNWYCAVVTSDTVANEHLIYVDKANLASSSTDLNNYNSLFDPAFSNIGTFKGASEWFKGKISEVMIFNRTISSADVTDICDDFLGLNFFSFNYPTPADLTTDNKQQTFNLSCLSGGVTLFLDNETNPKTVINGFNNPSPFIWVGNFSKDSKYYYKGSCNNGTISNSTIRSYTYDFKSPTINLLNTNSFNENNISFFNQYQDTRINFNISVFDNISKLYGFEFNLTTLNKSSIFLYSNISLNLSSSTNFNYSYFLNSSSLSIKNTRYILDLWASDSHTIKEIKDYDIKSINNGLEFTTDKNIKPIKVYSNDKSVFTAEKQKDRYEFNLNFDSKGTKKREIYLESDDKIVYLAESKFKGHFIIGDGLKNGNWLDFEGVDENPKIEQINKNKYKITFNNLADNVKFKSIGGLNIEHKTYSFYLGLLTKINNNAVSNFPFSLGLNLSRDSSILDINAVLIYNGTNYASILTKDSNANYISFSALLPAYNITSDTYFNYYWNVSIMQNGYNYSFIEYGQNLISSYILDNCSLSSDKTAIFKVFNEDSINSILPASFEIDLEYSISGSDAKQYTYFKQELSNLTNNLTLCLYPNNQIFSTNAYIKYSTSNGFTQRWYLVNGSLSNITKIFNMGNYNTTTGISTLKLTVRNQQDYSYFKNVYVTLERYYLNLGEWVEVQKDKSDEFGLTSFNIKERIIDYRLIFRDSFNNVLFSSVSSKFMCSSGVCELTQGISEFDSSSLINPAITILEYINSSKTITLNWYADNTINLLFEVYKNTNSNKINICSSTQSGTSGFNSCNVSGYTGNIRINLYQNGDLIRTSFIDITSPNSLSQVTNKDNTFILVFGIIITIGLSMIISPAVVIIASVLSLIVLTYLNILTAFSGIITGLIIILGIITALAVRE